MTTWKDNGNHGQFHREIVGDSGKYAICYVRTKHYVFSSDGDTHKWSEESWLEGEENFCLILSAPQMLEALEKIAALNPPRGCGLVDMIEVHSQCVEIARDAIAATKEGIGK